MTATTRAARQRGSSAELLDPADARDDHGSRQSRGTSPSKSASPSSEKPVRRQLRNTSITAPEDATSENDVTGDASSEAGSAISDMRRASPQSHGDQKPIKKKRSFDEVDDDNPDAGKTTGSKHLRKRSKSEEEASPPPGDEADKADDAQSKAEEQPEGEEPQKPLPTMKLPQSGETEQPSEVEASVDTASDLHSRDRVVYTPPRDTATNALMNDSLPTSPPNKRTREQFASEHHDRLQANPSQDQAALTGANGTTDPTTSSVKEPSSATEGPERKRSKDDRVADPQVAKVPPSSGFSNTSTESPFSSISTKKPSEPSAQTSSSAFSSSGFASFASSSASPFGAVNTGSKKADTKQTESEGTTKPAVGTSGFASLAGVASPFAATKSNFGSGSPFASTSGFGATSGFGSLGGGFAQTGAGPALSSFASPNGGSGIIGSSSKQPKPFGAAAPEEDDEEEGESSEVEDHAIKTSAEDDQKDPRFFEQDVETGEEGEETIYSTRAKLYVTSEKQWKERSVGVFKVNVAVEEDAEDSRGKAARFIMRADGSHRVALNSPITKDIEIRDPAGGPPKGKNAIFLGFIDGQPKLMQLKMKTPQQAIEFHQAVTYLQASM